VLHRFYAPDWPRNRIAGLARLVDDAAGAADAVAIDILNYSALQLATLVASVRTQLWKPEEAVDVAYSGGVFGSGLLLERFRLLVELEPGTCCGPPKLEPARGALLEAYRSAGLRSRWG